MGCDCMNINDFKDEDSKNLFLTLVLIHGEVHTIRKIVQKIVMVLVLISLILLRISCII